MKNSAKFYISSKGFREINQKYDLTNPLKNIDWTIDPSIELPICIENLEDKETPITLWQQFKDIVEKIPYKIAINSSIDQKENKKWTFSEYFEEVCSFSKALISLNIGQNKNVLLVLKNKPEWFFSFYGTIFSNNISVIIDPTLILNQYEQILNETKSELIIIDTHQNLEIFLKLIIKFPFVKYIILTNDDFPSDLIPLELRKKIILFKNLIKIGRQFNVDADIDDEDHLENRVLKLNPGKTCSIVYTNSLKGVLISHDNYIWTSKRLFSEITPKISFSNEKLFSYFSLHYIQTHLIDVISSLIFGVCVYFYPEFNIIPKLISILQDVEPTIFYSSALIWKEMGNELELIVENLIFSEKILDWAKSFGKEASISEIKGLRTPFSFSLTKNLIFQRLKNWLGLGKIRILMNLGNDIDTNVNNYLLSINIIITSIYGFAEGTGVLALNNNINGYKIIDKIEIEKYNDFISFKGRNRCLGYYNNEELTKKSLNKNNIIIFDDIIDLENEKNIIIKGRNNNFLQLKSGDLINPELIEQYFKKEINFISNSMLIGGNKKKYLIILFTLHNEKDLFGNITDKFDKISIKKLEEIGCYSESYSEIITNINFKQSIEKKINEYNVNIKSNERKIIKWGVLPRDFSTGAGEITIMQRLNREKIIKNNYNLIEILYEDPKL